MQGIISKHKRDDIQVTTRPETLNSFVSPGARNDFEIDTTDMESKGAVTSTRYGRVAIDNFKEFTDVVPIKDKTLEAMVIGLKHIFTSMGKPKQLRAISVIRFKYLRVETLEVS